MITDAALCTPRYKKQGCDGLWRLYALPTHHAFLRPLVGPFFWGTLSRCLGMFVTCSPFTPCPWGGGNIAQIHQSDSSFFRFGDRFSRRTEAQHPAGQIRILEQPMLKLLEERPSLSLSVLTWKVILSGGGCFYSDEQKPYWECSQHGYK